MSYGDFSASEGWGGDRYALYANGDDEVLVLAAAWDSPGDRDEFVKAYKRFAEAKYGQLATGIEEDRMWWQAQGEVAVLRWSDLYTVVVTAPDLETANRVLDRVSFADL
ncbi:MAG: hypothetical protein P8129_18590 [Anaerolineae bacterium]